MTTRGGFLVDEDPRLFDPSFFGITGLEVETMDASQRKLLEVRYASFENAGETWESISGSNPGVFVGNFSLDHWVTQARVWDYQDHMPLLVQVPVYSATVSATYLTSTGQGMNCYHPIILVTIATLADVDSMKPCY